VTPPEAAPTSPVRLDGKRILITGAARGQGAVEARMFAGAGARVLLADVLTDQGEAVAREIGDSARFVRLDVSSPDEWARVMQVAHEWAGGLDVLVNNAGIVRAAPLADMSLQDYRAVIDVS